jgi:hypothetical protein
VDIHPEPAKQSVQTMYNTHTISVDVHPEPQKHVVQTLLKRLVCQMLFTVSRGVIQLAHH